jgi:hypothetical protein
MNVYVYTIRVVRVASRGKISVYVYAEGGQPHHLPHCNVRWPDGDAQVALPTLLKIIGDDLPAQARELLHDHLEDICALWNQLNPGRMIQC